ncbi:16S rRNA (uracil(1498)-N(3))-methyltransferase [Microbacterium aurantiacum]|uniref:Ribosomal RNA small subunit methyltransferase E n=1 Tax=Microbacterium aurantiacum TaxID=162393 RepID=A0A0N0RR99_9MICO|nr:MULTISPECIES: 16S rRNA (uracil(1498)-N(3))-methyltransferase [Microbacterium]KOS10045.1 16S rRNA methyltransferase [Microbacterium chocolatum]
MALHFVTDAVSDAAVGDDLVLSGTEAHHAATVRRVRAGEAVTIGDGRGVWAEGTCTEVAPRRVVVAVTVRREVPASRPRVVLVQALAKGDRDELAVQASTELGVDEIVPWQAERSVSRWDAAKAIKGRARWTTIVREAAKQAHRAWIPAVAPLATTREVASAFAAAHLVVLDPDGSERVSELRFTDDEDVVLVVGPEGGISDGELRTFSDAGAVVARLGDTVLRTSTAGPAALAVLSASLERW